MIDVGTDRQLFVDRTLNERASGLELRLHVPTCREVVWQPREPWEGNVCWTPCVVRDGGRYRMGYRAEDSQLAPEQRARWDFIAYTESDDGINRERTNIGLIEFTVSTRNNLVWPPSGRYGVGMCVVKDDNPGTTVDERYKAIGNESKRGPADVWGVMGLVSPDGIHCREATDGAIPGPGAVRRCRRRPAPWLLGPLARRVRGLRARLDRLTAGVVLA